MNSRYSVKEEIANAVSHGLGTVLGVAALIVLLVNSLNGTAIHVVSSAIYGATFIGLYLSSTLYHAIPFKRAKAVFQKLDHLFIFVFIAGSYTPFTLVTLHGGWGWSLFGVVWGLALAGGVLEFFNFRWKKKISLLLYVTMGWLIVVAFYPMLQSIEKGGLFLLFLGGVLYSAGVFFYVKKSLPFNHAIWHLFVLAGSILQFFAVLFYVIP